MKSRYRIKEFREAMNLSQEELAIKANVSRTTISNLETGKATEASTVTLRRIAEALEKKPNEIFLSQLSNMLDENNNLQLKRENKE